MSGELPSVFAHIVTYNSEAVIHSCLDSALRQQGYEIGQNYRLELTDNASDQNVLQLLSTDKYEGIKTFRNEQNLGFSAAHNQAVSRFLESQMDYFVVLNPDLVLTPQLFLRLVEVAESGERIGLLTPLLFRFDPSTAVDRPKEEVIDAAGMILTSDLRHFDRGSGEMFHDQYNQPELVFGGTGACLMLSRECIQHISFRGEHFERDLLRVYPDLAPELRQRTQLFDEAFFAYREDADLAWRANLLGWKCCFVPEAKAFHVRRVLPERRKALPVELNRLGVKNRFLLQWNNMTWPMPSRVFVRGIVFRNLLVLIACILVERSSFSGLIEALKLRRRAKERARMVYRRSPLSKGKFWSQSLLNGGERNDEF